MHSADDPARETRAAGVHTSGNRVHTQGAERVVTESRRRLGQSATPSNGIGGLPLPGRHCDTPLAAAASVATEMGNLGLTPAEEEAIVAFLKTLTDGFLPDPRGKR